ncbi:MAG: xanthine dehydrogenase accessory protein XdhC [Burkholderiales bacterium]|nr:xanthine dehydrogenase accessory protein XdhC [Burkholderiales bacterium]
MRTLLDALDGATPAVWVLVAAVRGSAPRDPGAGMLVTADRTAGTIGGGHLEWKAIELARARLRSGERSATQRHFPLGPALGQCCGGAVDLLFLPIDAAARGWVDALARAEAAGGAVCLATALDAGPGHTRVVPAAQAVAAGVLTRHVFDPWPIWIFGAGHLGAALVQVLGALPCAITWVDARADLLARAPAADVAVRQAEQPADEVGDIPAGADVLVLTHSHALDFAIVRALVARDDLGMIGMVGSDTKAALFRRRLADRGVSAPAIARLVCPIGAKAHGDKHPGAIAVGVAADLLARRAARRAQTDGARGAAPDGAACAEAAR